MNTIHVIPVGGTEPIHEATSRCWCQPVAWEETPGGVVVAHNAKDTRERFERNGETLHMATLPWVLIGGSYTPEPNVQEQVSPPDAAQTQTTER